MYRSRSQSSRQNSRQQLILFIWTYKDSCPLAGARAWIPDPALTRWKIPTIREEWGLTVTCANVFTQRVWSLTHNKGGDSQLRIDHWHWPLTKGGHFSSAIARTEGQAILFFSFPFFYFPLYFASFWFVGLSIFIIYLLNFDLISIRFVPPLVTSTLCLPSICFLRKKT